MNEDDYKRRHHGYDDEARDLVDLLIDFVQVMAVLGLLTFIVLGLIGYWSAL